MTQLLRERYLCIQCFGRTAIWRLVQTGVRTSCQACAGRVSRPPARPSRPVRSTCTWSPGARRRRRRETVGARGWSLRPRAGPSAEGTADALIVALLHDDEVVPEVPAEPHDQLVHVLVTENRVIRTAAGPAERAQIEGGRG